MKGRLKLVWYFGAVNYFSGYWVMSMEVAQPLLLSKERVLVPPWWELTSMDDFQVLNFSSKLSRNFCFIENAFVIPTIYQGTGLSGNENWFKMKGRVNLIPAPNSKWLSCMYPNVNILNFLVIEMKIWLRLIRIWGWSWSWSELAIC